MAFFLQTEGSKNKNSYRDPKRHFLARNDVFWRILRTNPFKSVGLIEEPPKTKKLVTSVTAKSHILGRETDPIATKFCMPGAIQDVIMPANFG